ncbi:hypothetical protein O3P69_007875 [Scylla paramamosain]
MQRLPSKSSLERSVRRKRQRTDNAREIPHTRNFDIPPEYQEIILHDSGVDDVDRIICMGDINIVTNLSGNIFEELVLTLPQEPEVEEVVAYFESNYIRGMQIGGRRRDPRFPIKLWNHFEDAEECAPKTTNCCEGFHNALKSVYMCAHPTMWKFLKGIARDIAVQRLVHQNALVHRRDAPTNKYIKLAQRLATKIKMYRAEVDKLLYLRAVANMQVV